MAENISFPGVVREANGKEWYGTVTIVAPEEGGLFDKPIVVVGNIFEADKNVIFPDMNTLVFRSSLVCPFGATQLP